MSEGAADVGAVDVVGAAQESDLSISSEEKASNAFKIFMSEYEKALKLVDNDVFAGAAQESDLSISSEEKASNAFKIFMSAYKKALELVDNDAFAEFMLYVLIKQIRLCDGTQYLILAESKIISKIDDIVDDDELDKVPDPSVHLQKPEKIPLRLYFINGSSFVFHPKYSQDFSVLLTKYAVKIITCVTYIYVEQAVIDNPKFWVNWSDN